MKVVINGGLGSLKDLLEIVCGHEQGAPAWRVA
jgi:hypothetical protein